MLELIHELYDKLSLFIDAGQPRVKKPDIYTHLKMSIENEKAYWDKPQYKKKIHDKMMDEVENRKVEVTAQV